MLESNVRALSIAGPFAYAMASQVELKIPEQNISGHKQIEIRPWKTKLRQTLVLLHISQTKEFDEFFRYMPFGLEKCPKSSIIGAALLTDCLEYNKSSKNQFHRDYERHCWITGDDFQDVYDQYSKPFFGHVFEEFLVFPKPILNVPGDRNYWVPNPKKQAQYGRQKLAFDQAIAQVKLIKGDWDQFAA